MNSNFFVDVTFKEASHITTEYLYKKLKPVFIKGRPLVIVSIGSDRATGDCLGPLVGSNLNFNALNVYSFGSLENPVHSKNLKETLLYIESNFENPYVIAIDASLGSMNSIGKVFIEDSPLSPGLALNKNLPQVGNLSITGVVNISGNYEFMVLQNTRLYTVMLLAKFISNSLSKTINLLDLEINKAKASS